MNIFTNDDYRKIQAWLKANAIKDSDLAQSESTIPDKDIITIVQKVNGIPTNFKINIKDFLNSSLNKIIIQLFTANAIKVNNSLVVDVDKIIINEEENLTLQAVFDSFNNHLNDVNSASKGWNIEYQDPSIDEPTVRAKYVLKDYKGVPKGNPIKVYKDSAITNVYLGTTEDICDENTGEVTKNPIQNNNEALSIVYRLDTGKYSLVNVPIGIFIKEAEFDKYRGLGITENGQVFIKLANDVESSNYLHFNDSGEVSADGIENRILQDLGTIINSVADDGTMWGQYKKEEGTKDSPINEASRWGQYKQAEANRNERLNNLENKIEEEKTAIIDTNRIANGAVTIPKLSADIQALIANLSKNYVFAGIATPTTNPGTPDGPVFYIAGEGTYANFSNIVIEAGQLGILKWNGSWHKEVLEIGAGGGNMILDWNTDVATTRKQVSSKERKAGMQISYKPDDEDWVNEQYIGTSLTDTEWIKDNNWEQIPNQSYINEINLRKALSITNLNEIVIDNTIMTKQNCAWCYSNGKIKLNSNANGWIAAEPIILPKGTLFSDYKSGLEIDETFGNSSGYRGVIVADKDGNVLQTNPFSIDVDFGYCYFSSDTNDRKYMLYPAYDNFLIQKNAKINTENLLTKAGYLNSNAVLASAALQKYRVAKIDVNINDEFYIDYTPNNAGKKFAAYDSNGTYISDIDIDNTKNTIYKVTDSRIKSICFSAFGSSNYQYPLCIKLNTQNSDYLRGLTNAVVSISDTFYVKANKGDESLPLNSTVQFPLEINLKKGVGNTVNLCPIGYSAYQNTDITYIDLELLEIDGQAATKDDYLGFMWGTRPIVQGNSRRIVMMQPVNYPGAIFYSENKDLKIKVYGIKVKRFYAIESLTGIEQWSMGDSITAANNSYADLLSTILKTNITKNAVVGWTLQQLTTDERLQSIPDNVRLATITGGTNGPYVEASDFEQKGYESVDANSTIGSINRAINAVMKKNVDCTVILIAPIYCKGRMTAINKTRDAMEKIAQVRGVHFFDSSIYVPFNEYNSIVRGQYTVDAIHPNSEIYLIWFNLLYDFINRILVRKL